MKIKKFLIFLGLSVVVAFVAFCVMFWFALRQGPSLEVLTNRVSKSLMVDPSRLSFLGGDRGRDPSVFFMLSGEIPEKADVEILKGWAREHNGKLFDRLATAYHIPCAVKDHGELLNYKGEVFDLYLAKTQEGYCVLYFGF